MSSLATLEYDHRVGFYYRRSPSGRIAILPEDQYHDDDAPTEAGDPVPSRPTEGAEDHEGDGDEWLDDPMLMGVDDAA